MEGNKPSLSPRLAPAVVVSLRVAVVLVFSSAILVVMTHKTLGLNIIGQYHIISKYIITSKITANFGQFWWVYGRAPTM